MGKFFKKNAEQQAVVMEPQVSVQDRALPIVTGQNMSATNTMRS